MLHTYMFLLVESLSLGVQFYQLGFSMEFFASLGLLTFFLNSMYQKNSIDPIKLNSKWKDLQTKNRPKYVNYLSRCYNLPVRYESALTKPFIGGWFWWWTEWLIIMYSLLVSSHELCRTKSRFFIGDGQVTVRKI